MRFSRAAFFLTVLLLASCAGRDRYVRFRGYAQGGVYSVTVNLKGVKATADELHSGIDSILTLVDTTLSGYNKGSMLSRFNRGETIRPNSLFIDMYAFAREWWERTDGALDCAAAPVYDAWGFGFKNDTLPSDDEVREILARCGMARLKASMADAIAPDGILSPGSLLADPSPVRGLPCPPKGKSLPCLSGPSGNLASRPDPSSPGPLPFTRPRAATPFGGQGSPRREVMPALNYNAVAQGWTCDMIAEWLRERGVRDMLVDIGEIRCEGLNPSGRPWTLGVDSPYDGNETPGESLQGLISSEGKPCGIVTSGNYRKFYVRDGRKYAHTIDPRTGFPAENGLLSATVRYPSAAGADAIATWFMVIGPDEARRITLETPNLDAYLIMAGPDGSFQTWSSIHPDI